jgi:RNA polymerase sigma-70 factor (ECF subfamily)
MQQEPDLIQRCREGDPQAQRELYDLTVGRIYRLLLRLTHNEQDAFDLAQETYLRAFTKLGEFGGRSSFATWVYRIAVNEALQFLRRENRGQGAAPFDPAGRNRIPDFAGDPKMEAGGEDQTISRLDLNDALEELAPIDRTMLLLRYQEGLDYRAIGEITGCPEGTVASRLNRARSRLREKLADGYATREEIAPAVHPMKGSAGPAS